jgi:hypothetical protein
MQTLDNIMMLIIEYANKTAEVRLNPLNTSDDINHFKKLRYEKADLYHLIESSIRIYAKEEVIK